MTDRERSYLAHLRNDANITQATMARIMGVKQNQISRWEKNPDAMNAAARDEYLRNCGFPSPPTVMGLVPPTVTGLVPDAATRDALQENIRVLLRYVDTVSPSDLSPSEELPGSLPAVNDLLQNVRFLACKPRIGVVGRYDQGKSRLVNTLLGSDCLPTAYQPATSLICLVRHVLDRPEWMQADPEFMNQDAFIFKSKDTEIVENGDSFVGKVGYFDFERLDDADYFRRFRCVSGGLEILRDFGTRRGRHATRAEEQDMVAALAFVDAPLLRTCDVLDFPGYDDGDPNESRKPEFAKTLFDIPVYVSGCIGFFNAADREYVDSLIKQLPPVEDEDSSVPPLRNVFFVATRASHFDGEDIDKEILDPAAERTHRHLEGSLRIVRAGGVTGEDFRKRFFTFDAEGPEWRSAFESDFTELLEKVYPSSQGTRVERAIQGTRNNAIERLANYERYVDGLLRDSSSKAKELEEMESLEPARKDERNRHAEYVRGRIEKFRRDTNAFVQDDLRNECSLNRIHNIILEKFNKRKLAKDEAPQYVVNRLRNRLDEFVGSKAHKLADDIETLHGLYGESLGGLRAKVPFDSRGAFIAALSGLGTFGALATWASVVAAGSNLGAYILTAKVVSVLSAMGISVGGTASAASAIALIGGPVTIMIALAIMVAFVSWSLFGASWQERLAKRIHKAIEKQNCIKKLAEGADTYWTDTRNAFDKAFTATEKEYREYMKGLRKHLDKAGPAALERQKEQVASLMRAFEGIPWRGLGSRSDS